MIRIVSVVGARPNFMKAAPVRAAFDRIDEVEHVLVHTGQHYDRNMSDVFFEDLDMAPPDIYLGVGSGSHAEQTAAIMTAFEREVMNPLPDMVIVYGDVNSTVAATLTAKKLGVPCAHVESGLRSFDRAMPEELNRIVTDAICDLRFVTEESGRRHLLLEGVDSESIHFVGNTMIDSLAALVNRLGQAEPGDYFALTLHRPSNVDDPASLRRLLEAIDQGAGGREIRFPVHPRTRKILESSGLHDWLEERQNWQLSAPMGYREFIELVRSSRGVITDSGGIQEETTWLGVPCVTLRDSTERPSTIEHGTNVLVGVDPGAVRRAVERIATVPAHRNSTRPPLWDGHAAERIATAVMRYLVNRA